MGQRFHGGKLTDTPFDPDDYEDPEPRLPRGYLALDVDNICKDFAAGRITLPEGKYMTAWQIGTELIKETDGERKRPSPGAIDAVLKKWEKAGYAKVRHNPCAFVSFTDAGRLMGSWNIYQENFGTEGPDNTD